MAAVKRTPEQQAEVLALIAELTGDLSTAAAGMYAAFLNVPVPENPQGIARFNASQAFELTKSIVYEMARNQDL